MCKLHGVRLIRGIKIFESMLQNENLPSLLTKLLRVSFQHCSSIIVRISRAKKLKTLKYRSSFVYLANRANQLLKYTAHLF